jgi:hypothetical protein
VVLESAFLVAVVVVVVVVVVVNCHIRDEIAV